MIAIGPAPIELETLIADVARPEHGAICTFVGTTRETSPGDARPVVALEYEAYEAMAVPELQRIAEEVHERFAALGVAMVHRVGRVALGEPSVCIVVAAPHRGAAFDACRYAIDELKRRVPIWKREVYADGEAAWIGNTAS